MTNQFDSPAEQFSEPQKNPTINHPSIKEPPFRTTTPPPSNLNYQYENPSSGKGKKIAIVILILITIGVAGLVGALYTKFFNPLWNPFRPEPSEILSLMGEKMKTMKTFHSDGNFEISVNQYSKSIDIIAEVILDVDRTITKNPNFKGSVKIPIFLAKIGFIKIDKDFYLEPGILSSYLEKFLGEVISQEYINQFGGFKNKWIKINQETAEKASSIITDVTGEELDIKEEISQEKQTEIIQEITKLFAEKKLYDVKEELPDEKIEKKIFYHYVIGLNQEEIKKLLIDLVSVMMKYAPENEYMDKNFAIGTNIEIQNSVDNFFETVGDVNFEVWIDQENNYLHRFKFEKSDFNDEEVKSLESILLDITFSQHDQAIKIEPPEEFIDMAKFLEGAKVQIEETVNKKRATARDARRESDIRQISIAMEMHYDENDQKYLQAKTMPSAIGKYLNPIPQEPGGGLCPSYQWISNIYDAQQYCAWACLGDGRFFAASEKGTKKLDKEPANLSCW